MISPPALYLDFVLKNLRKDAAVCAQNVWPGEKVVLVAGDVLYFKLCTFPLSKIRGLLSAYI